MRINYTSGLDFLAIDRGQTGIPVGLKSADSLAHQDQDAGAGLYWAIWDEATQGYRPSLPPNRPIAFDAIEIFTWLTMRITKYKRGDTQLMTYGD